MKAMASWMNAMMNGRVANNAGCGWVWQMERSFIYDTQRY
jgi:hypothetical protein